MITDAMRECQQAQKVLDSFFGLTISERAALGGSMDAKLSEAYAIQQKHRNAIRAAITDVVQKAPDNSITTVFK